jgi:F0F1-type ATP synthase membrane subunit b/b'
MHLPPDWGIFGALVVSFLIFWGIFGWLFFGPFLRLLSDRERRLSELNTETARLLSEERAALDRRASELAEVRRVALVQREQERRAAQDKATQLIGEARAAARDELEKVRAGIDGEFAAAARQLEELAGVLAAELAARVLGRPVGNDAHARLNN